MIAFNDNCMGDYSVIYLHMQSKMLIIAPPASGKTTAAKELGIADIDWWRYVFDKVNSNKRNPNFPVNYLSDTVEAFKNSPVVVANPGFVITDIIEMLAKHEQFDSESSFEEIKTYARKAVTQAETILFVHIHKIDRNAVRTNTEIQAQINSEVDKLTPEINALAKRLLSVLKDLKSISPEPTLLIPADVEAKEAFITRTYIRASVPGGGGRPPEKTKDAERAWYQKRFDESEQLLKTGLYSKLPLYGDEVLSHAIRDTENRIQRPQIPQKKLTLNHNGMRNTRNGIPLISADGT